MKKEDSVYGACNDGNDGMDNCENRWRNFKETFRSWKDIRDRETKQQLDEILDQVRELKQSASELEDENRELREKMRFRSDEYEFRTPFWYHKAHPNQPLCPKCFASDIAAPMGEKGQGSTASYRRCLVCHDCIDLDRIDQGPTFSVVQRGEW
jgi:hypothetical protein